MEHQYYIWQCYDQNGLPDEENRAGTESMELTDIEPGISQLKETNIKQVCQASCG